MSFTNKDNNSIQKPRVSVFVPSYNHAIFIERCLKSIIKQIYQPTELLVIDDGSTDGSTNVIERVLKDCPFPSELIVRPNKGLCHTLNEGLTKTSGDYFAYLGSDDVWLPEFIEARVSLLESKPKAVLGYGNAFLIDENDRIIECSDSWRHSDYKDGDARPMLYKGFSLVSSSVFYRRSVLEKKCWNEESRLEDYELYLQLAEYGEFAFDKRFMSAWRMHGTNTSRNSIWMLDEMLKAQKRAAANFGWNEKKLSKIQTSTKFFFSEYLAINGQKSEAFSMFIRNFRGSDSFIRFTRAALRLAIPNSFLKARRRFAQDKTAKQFGVLKT